MGWLLGMSHAEQREPQPHQNDNNANGNQSGLPKSETTRTASLLGNIRKAELFESKDLVLGRCNFEPIKDDSFGRNFFFGDSFQTKTESMRRGINRSTESIPEPVIVLVKIPFGT